MTLDRVNPTTALPHGTGFIFTVHFTNKETEAQDNLSGVGHKENLW